MIFGRETIIPGRTELRDETIGGQNDSLKRFW